ncbi:MAG: hypothetical protein ABSA11_01575 [Candidatus Bathyarchaeia archaeon]|jgi:hypothetical protein
MSSGFSFSISRMIVALFGFLLLVLGGIMTYLALTVEGAAPTRFFTPLGFLIAILGFFLLLSKDA